MRQSPHTLLSTHSTPHTWHSTNATTHGIFHTRHSPHMALYTHGTLHTRHSPHTTFSTHGILHTGHSTHTALSTDSPPDTRDYIPRLCFQCYHLKSPTHGACYRQGWYSTQKALSTHGILHTRHFPYTALIVLRGHAFHIITWHPLTMSTSKDDTLHRSYTLLPCQRRDKVKQVLLYVT